MATDKPKRGKGKPPLFPDQDVQKLLITVPVECLEGLRKIGNGAPSKGVVALWDFWLRKTGPVKR